MYAIHFYTPAEAARFVKLLRAGGGLAAGRGTCDGRSPNAGAPPGVFWTRFVS